MAKGKSTRAMKPDERARAKRRFLEEYPALGWDRAADAVGVDRSLPLYWLRHDKKFRAEYEALGPMVAVRLENKLDAIAMGECGVASKSQVTAAIFRLKALNRPKYQDRFEVTGKDGSAIKVEDGCAQRGVEIAMGLIKSITGERARDDAGGVSG